MSLAAAVALLGPCALGHGVVAAGGAVATMTSLGLWVDLATSNHRLRVYGCVCVVLADTDFEAGNRSCATASVIFETQGEYPFFCEIHLGSMQA